MKDIIQETLKTIGNQLIAIGNLSLMEDMLKYIKANKSTTPVYHKLKGKIFYIKGNLPKALDSYLEAMKKAKKDTNQMDIFIEAKIKVGWIYYRQGNLSMALNYVHDAFISSRENNFTNLEVECLNKLGWIFDRYEKPEVTRGFYIEAERFATSLKDKRIQAHVLESLGNFYIEQEELEKAYQVLKKGLKLFREIEHEEGIAYINRNLGHFYFKDEKYQEAKEQYKKSLSYYDKLGYKLGIIRVKIDIGYLKATLDDIEEGVEDIKEALKISPVKSDLSGHVFGEYRLGKIYAQLAKNEDALAITHLLRAKGFQLKYGHKTHRLVSKINRVLNSVIRDKTEEQLQEIYNSLPVEIQKSIPMDELYAV